MWKCASCGYVNEQWDENCLRCGAEMQPGQPQHSAASNDHAPDIGQSTAAPVTKASAPRPPAAPAADPYGPPLLPGSLGTELQQGPARPLDRFAMLAILLSVLGIIAIGLIAWQQGKLESYGLPGPGGSTKLPPTAEGEPQHAADPLAELKTLRVRNIKHFRPFVDFLETSEDYLNAMVITDSAPGQLSSESQENLAKLQELGDELSLQYEDFEQKAAQYRTAELQQPQKIIRDAFAVRFEQFLQLLGTAYAIDGQGVHPAYLYSDKIPALLTAKGQIDPAGAAEKWKQALHNREQYRLDQDYEDIYRQQVIRYETLVAMHKQMNEAIQTIPSEKSRGGTLDRHSNDLLTLYNDIMVKVEESVVEYEEYLAGLGSIERSDRMKAHIEEFTKLAQEDHLFAFTETYKIYEGDRQLEHPSYTWLELHFEFARTHWPEISQTYRDIYTYYEDRWERFWVSDEETR